MVVGRNGQGKTSLLEAVYLLGTGRSFRSRNLEELAEWESGPLRVSGVVQNRLGRQELTVILHDGEKRTLADGLERPPDDFLGRLDLVDLTASRMQVLRGGPEERRRFLDRGVVGLDPAFLHNLGEYRRVLQHRNALLRRLGAGGGGAANAELAVWDERLVEAAWTVHRRRREYAVTLGATLGEATRALFPQGTDLVLRYRPSPVETGEALGDEFREILTREMARGRARDLQVGHTCRGPHRDELRVELDGIDLRKYGSAGQVRASMAALKLGKITLLKRDRGESPLFLMDDFDSDLDEARAAALAEHLHEGGFQTLVATSKEEMAERLGVTFTRFRMDDGKATAA